MSIIGDKNSSPLLKRELVWPERYDHKAGGDIDPGMILAVTRILEKGEEDAPVCIRYGHSCYPVSPLRSEILWDRVRECAEAVNRGNYDCIFFSSALPARILGPLIHRWPRTIAIGPRTAETLAVWNVEVETLPSFYSRDFVPYLGSWLSGKRVGIPRADVPNPGLITAIEEAGAVADEIRCYRLIPTREVLEIGRAQALLFTSAGSFRAAVWRHRPDLLLLAIGEITAAAMKKGGHSPAVIGDGSLEGTLVALNRYLEHHHAG
jgi:uroporphyrinogen-III synthase